MMIKPVKFYLRKNSSRHKKSNLHQKKRTNQGILACVIHDPNGYWLIDTLLGAILIGTASTLALSLINTANDGVDTMTQRSKVAKAMTTRMDEIRKQAFQLHCLSGYACDDGSVSLKVSYDKSKIKDECTNKTMGQSLLSELEQKNLNSNFNLQAYDPTSPSTTISLDLTPINNGLEVTLTEDRSNAKLASTIVPTALGWCE